MCGSGGRLLLWRGTSSSIGVPAGDATEAVERREAAMVRRMCDSVDRVVFTTQAVFKISFETQSRRAVNLRTWTACSFAPFFLLCEDALQTQESPSSFSSKG
jgi:hypothetical protein